MIEVNDNNFEEVVMKSTKPVVLDFWAPWCGPCRMVSPVLEELSTQNENVEFVKCNVDDNPQSAMKFGIRSIPTVMYIKDGEVKGTTIGAVTKSTYENKIKELL